MLVGLVCGVWLSGNVAVGLRLGLQCKVVEMHVAGADLQVGIVQCHGASHQLQVVASQIGAEACGEAHGGVGFYQVQGGQLGRVEQEVGFVVVGFEVGESREVEVDERVVQLGVEVDHPAGHVSREGGALQCLASQQGVV